MAIELTPDQLHKYKEEGYVVVHNLIPTVDIGAVRAMLRQIEEGDVNLPPEYAQYPDQAKVTNSKGLRIAAGVQGPATWSPVFKTVADHPNLQSVMSQLLDGPVERFTDQCGIKTGYIKTEQAG